MTTEKQIAANRANAKKSTGPKTALGKLRSSGNAFRHGLSKPMPEDAATLSMIDAVAQVMAGHITGELNQTAALARSHLELARVRGVRAALMEVLSDNPDGRSFRRLAALDRYERMARTKCRRAKNGF